MLDDAPILVVATRNPGKVREFSRLLAAYPWQLRSLDDVGFDGVIEETEADYAGNARLKAHTVTAATGLPSIADDSGIEVLALRGWPGPASARWLGPDADDWGRLLALLDEVERRAPEDRRVQYVSAVALARPAAEPVVAHGRCTGTLIEPEGAGGFGYDPGFLSDDLGITFGNATAADKDRVSHRARAVARLAAAGLLDRPARPRDP